MEILGQFTLRPNEVDFLVITIACLTTLIGASSYRIHEDQSIDDEPQLRQHPLQCRVP